MACKSNTRLRYRYVIYCTLKRPDHLQELLKEDKLRHGDLTEQKDKVDEKLAGVPMSSGKNPPPPSESWRYSPDRLHYNGHISTNMHSLQHPAWIFIMQIIQLESDL